MAETKDKIQQFFGLQCPDCGNKTEWKIRKWLPAPYCEKCQRRLKKQGTTMLETLVILRIINVLLILNETKNETIRQYYADTFPGSLIFAAVLGIILDFIFYILKDRKNFR